MKAAINRFSAWVVNHAMIMWVIMAAFTLFFAIGLRTVDIRTVFSDLLPKDDPYVKVFSDHPNFGNPLTMTVMVKRKDGKIYNSETLKKIWNLTRDIDLAPGVDHDTIISITTEKARYAEATPLGVNMQPVMGDRVPTTPEELEDLRRRIEQSPNAKTFLVSRDESAAVIQATFLESKVDWGKAFAFVQNLVEKARDKDHEVYLAGQPALIGWVYKLRAQIGWIFIATFCALTVVLALYMRNFGGTVTPVICSVVAGIWGFGLAGWIRSPIEPLLLVVPVLLVARTFSHCVQYSERYYEILAHVRNKKKAVEICMSVMMVPSVFGIITDFLGITLIAMAPIPAMERFALFAGWWAIAIIPNGVILISLLLLALPTPKNIDKLVGQDTGLHGAIRNWLLALAKITYGKPAFLTAGFFAVLAVAATYLAIQIKIGNPVEGSNVLFPDSEYNMAVKAINRNFPGVNTLEIVIEAKPGAGQKWRVARSEEASFVRTKLQALIESSEHPPRATLSFTDYMMEGNRLFSGGSPKWLPLDPDPQAVNAAGTSVTMGSNPKNFANVSDYAFQNSTVSLWYADNKQETVDNALATAKKAVDAVGVDHKDFTVRLGTGLIALQQSMNNVTERFHYRILGALSLVIVILASLVYRSVIGGLLLIIPVLLSNFLLFAAMNIVGVGLDINSLMVAAVAVGVGIDYDIYLLSRICEEYHAHDGDWKRTIAASLSTTGKAILFTATVVLVGLTPWYFMSDLKFMSDMSILLLILVTINMIMALVVLPLLVWFIKPKFATRTDLIVGESYDLSDFTAKGSEIDSMMAKV
ncbi:hypothetical protein SAMN04488038_101264 [Solimonas aquatica]|uniref:Membrane transport protein MMPL domain-containing protein n=1 Tax=Solimonas aquatica TaxID=489703 RepID=A0A1H9A5R9_9GAMM|nr:MMPL family transporter [Solimonas aquatica]SEP71338.1 hypothetical protein SAMN04488038_101264 [Solimonas aquatica]